MHLSSDMDTKNNDTTTESTFIITTINRSTVHC